MRILFLSIILISTLFSAKSQKWGAWGSAGAHVSLNGNYIYNAEMFEDSTVGAQLGYNPSLGLDGSFNFNEFFQLGVKFKYGISSTRIKYNTVDSIFGYEGVRKLAINTYSADLFARYYAKRGGYVEGGISYNIVASAIDKEKDALTHLNVKNEMSNFSSIMFGIGMVAIKKQRVSVLVGLQAFYGISDLVSDFGNSVRYPLYRRYSSHSEHSLLTGSFTISVVYDAGRLNASRQTYRYSFFNRAQ